MGIRRVSSCVFGAIVATAVAAVALHAQQVGRNVNMVSGMTLPDGDPFLQRQNEPSGAISTRNSLHLLAGSNDYRTVDYPGLPDHLEIGDAWLGVFKSVDGGDTWTSTLLPGYPQDTSAEGRSSPLRGYAAGADPTVRAGTNGLFYYSGIVFNRGANEPSAVFVARYIDNNNVAGPKTMAYLDARVVATGKRGFTDKPYMVVDIPRDGRTCTINAPGARAAQQIPAGTVYVAYILFDEATTISKLVVIRSRDCGVTWSKPSIASEKKTVNQGVTMAIDPTTGALYLAWRELAIDAGRNGIVMTKSIDVGRQVNDRQPPIPADPAPMKFMPPVLVAEIPPFDQKGTKTTFRTNSYPTIAVDASSRIYLAWTERGWGPISATEPPWTGPNPPKPGDARIVLTVGNVVDENKSKGDDGRQMIAWSDRRPIENSPQSGHQVMPALTATGGRLTLLFYDLREDVAGVFESFIDELNTIRGAPVRRHTIDVRIAQGDLGLDPHFGPSVAVSQYRRGSRPGSTFIEQMQYNVPNFKLYAQGSQPFVGDYLDVAGEMIVQDQTGGWVFNTSTSGPSVQYALWTDNRDVRPPRDGDWANYTPPRSASSTKPCSAGQAGMRNANIYSARISPGLRVGSPDNSKRLSGIKKSFVVFAQNNTDVIRRYRFTIENQPQGGQASFLQFSPAGSPLTSLDATLAPRSQASRTVYATSSDPTARIVVNVVEVVVPTTPTPTPPIKPGGLTGAIVLNPDSTNPDVANPDVANNEVFNPDVANPDVANPDVANPNVTNPNLVNPDVANIVVSNPDVANPDVANPDVANPDVANPDVANPDVANPDVANGAYIDVTWTITNNGNTAGSFSVKTLLSKAAPDGFKLQLILHKVYTTPVVAEDCSLKTETHTVLIANIVNPDVANPDVANNAPGTTSSRRQEPDLSLSDGDAYPAQLPAEINPDVANPEVRNATLWLEPGESARITLRVLAPDRTQLVSKQVTLSDGRVVTVLVDPDFDPSEVAAPLVISQAVGTAEAQAGITTPPFEAPLFITTGSLPFAVLGQPYDQTLHAIGGTGTLTWTRISGTLPTGITLSPAGRLQGTSNLSSASTFIVRVTDQAGRSAAATLTLVVGAMISTTLTDQAALAVSNEFGEMTGSTMGPNGHFAFWESTSSMFYRAPGASAPVRAVQPGDPLPGLPTSRVLDVLAGGVPRINSAGVLVFGGEFFLGTSEISQFIATFDGTTLRRMVIGSDTAPGTGGATFARSLLIIGFNDAGDVLFSSNIINVGTHLFIARSSGSIVHVAGPGDALPFTGGGTLGGFGTPRLNNAGHVQFAASISGGTGGFGLFDWSPTGVRKVVASGDGNPTGGTFTFSAILDAQFNNLGHSMFVSGGSIYLDTPGTGISAAFTPAIPVPEPLGVTYSFGPTPALVALNDAGDLAINTLINTPFGGTIRGIFRVRPGQVVDIVAVQQQVATVVSFATISMNSSGAIAFRGDNVSNLAVGIFRQAIGGPLTNIVPNGAATPLGGTFDLLTSASVGATGAQSLNNGDVLFAADIRDGTADLGEFRWSPGGVTALMSSADTLPSGSRVLLAERAFGFNAAGDYVGTFARNAGGRYSVLVHRVSTQTSTIVATEGQTIPGLGGRLRLSNTTSVGVNANGQIALTIQPIGGPQHDRTAVFLASAGGLVKVAAHGDFDTAGRFLTTPSLNGGGSTNFWINASGQVVFSAIVAGGARGMFVGTGGGVPVKLAINGDTIAPGVTITGANSSQPHINSTGQVVLDVTTTGGAKALVIGTAGGPLTKIVRVGDPSPGGGTFTDFSLPSSNNSGEVVFVATVNGGPNGIFQASATASPVALALHGSAAPGGGIYSITAVQPDVLINDQHDVMFLADLTGGAADSGYFMRRGPTGVVQALVREGDPIPGSTDVFPTFQHSLNNRPGEAGLLGSLGDVSIAAGQVGLDQRRAAIWHIRTDSVIEPIFRRGISLPGFSGIPLAGTQLIPQWIDGGRYVTWMAFTGAPYFEAIVVFGPSPGTGPAPAPAPLVTAPTKPMKRDR